MQYGISDITYIRTGIVRDLPLAYLILYYISLIIVPLHTYFYLFYMWQNAPSVPNNILFYSRLLLVALFLCSKDTHVLRCTVNLG